MRLRDAWLGGRGGRGDAGPRRQRAQHEADPRADPREGPAGLSTAADVPAWRVEGPVQCEAFVLRMHGRVPELAGPCGPEPWYMEVGDDEGPVEVVSRLATNLLGRPLLVHST